MSTIKAAPGIYLVKEIKSENTLNLGTAQDKKILKGQIVSVGQNREHDDGGKLVSTFKEGDVIFFFSYVDNADTFEEEGEKYFAVIFNDARAQVIS